MNSYLQRTNMKGKQIYTVQTPSITREFAEALSRAFPPIEVKAGTPETDIKWNAAQRQVVQWVFQQSVAKTGNVNRVKT